jgi:hypothetical protein
MPGWTGCWHRLRERITGELTKLMLTAARPAAGIDAADADRCGRAGGARGARAADGGRRAPPAQGRLPALADGAEPGHRPGAQVRAGRTTWCQAGRAAARHRQAADRGRCSPAGRWRSTTTRSSAPRWHRRKRLTALRFPKDIVADDVRSLVELHLRFHGYGEGEWTDSAVRRYVTRRGAAADPAARAHQGRLHHQERRRRPQRLARAYDALEARIAELQRAGGAGQDQARARRQRDHARSSALPPGPLVGAGLPNYLLELRMSEGVLGRERAVQELLRGRRPGGDHRRRRSRRVIVRAVSQYGAATSDRVAAATDHEEPRRLACRRHERNG